MPRYHKPKFIDLVDAHEKAWGKTRYNGRPSLEQILSYPVVIFWQPVKKQHRDRHYITVHRSSEGVNKYLSTLYLNAWAEPPDRYIYAVFVQRKWVEPSLEVRVARHQRS